MTTKDLLKELNSYIGNDDKCKDYIQRINDILFSFPDNAIIDGLTGVDDFMQRGGYTTSRTDKAPRDLAQELFAILTEVRSWAKQYKGTRSKVLATRNSALKRGAKRRSVIFWVTIAVTGAALLTAIVLAMIQLFCQTSTGIKWDWIALVGILDALVGGVGFVVERILDHKNSAVYVDAEKAIESGSADNFVAKHAVNNGINNSKIKTQKNATIIGVQNNYGGNTNDIE